MQKLITLFTLSILLSLMCSAQIDEIKYGILSEGVRSFSKNGKMGFVDENNKIILSPRFFMPSDAQLPYFKEGLCAAFLKIDTSITDEYNNVLYGFIDYKFSWSISPQFPYDPFFCNFVPPIFEGGMTVVQIPKKSNEEINPLGSFIIINNKGEQIGTPFDNGQGCTAACSIFPEISEGLVVDYDGEKYGFREVATGKLIIPRQFSAAGPFSEGVAAVEIDGKYIVFINKYGQPILNKKFFTVKSGSRNKSLYSTDYGCTHTGAFRNGKIVLHYFDNNGTGPEVFSLIDKSGHVLIKQDPDKYYDDKRFSNYEWEFGRK